MARTKASVGAKVSSGKSSKARCSAAPPPSSNASSSNGEKSSRNYSGGNSVCPRETPKWQKPITNFFMCNQNTHSEGSDAEDDAGASSSKSKPKRNIIQSDDEDEQTDNPINKELDETIELEPLTGEDSHKIEEYYGAREKGKGKGKKTANKENMDDNIKRNPAKRNLEQTILDEETEHVNKKIKVD